MNLNRRGFLLLAGASALSCAAGAEPASAKDTAGKSGGEYGCLVDTTLCVGCRKCESACNQRHSLPKPEEPFNEMAVLEKMRRMDHTAYTVVNKYYPKNIGTLVWRQRPTFVKFQCMHCNRPSCVSACIVGALVKQPGGAVTYDADKCIGCRYCMVACPFQVPAYEYHDPLTPQVRKCTFCFEYVSQGQLPACAQACPREVITFGPKPELLRMARWKIRSNPGKYQDHIYGEHEVGGTSWLYLASEPFENIGLPKLNAAPPPELTETIQHAAVGQMILPLSLYGVLGAVMWLTGFLKRSGSHPDEANSEKGGKDE